jgi:hypothetical protein
MRYRDFLIVFTNSSKLGIKKKTIPAGAAVVAAAAAAGAAVALEYYR